MASVSAIRDGLKTRLATISGLAAYDTVPGQINPPAAVVTRRRTAFDATMARGSDDLTFVVLLFVSFAEHHTAQEDLDAYLAGSGAASVKAAVEVDPSLGGTCDFARVAAAEADRVVTYAGVDYLAVEFIVEVTADGTV